MTSDSPAPKIWG